MMLNMGRTAVLDTGTMEIVVIEGRDEPFDIGCFTHAGIDPATKKFLLIKSRQHFRAGFEPIVADIVMVAGPDRMTAPTSLVPPTWAADASTALPSEMAMAALVAPGCSLG